jgi:hypothetical protein
MSSSQKTFFLGIGAAKSGTSWLYDYLASHPEVEPGPIKEMHVLNSPGNKGILSAVQQLPWHRFAGRKWLWDNLRKSYYRADWNRYFSLYGRILDGSAKSTGEISTSYMRIPKDTLTMVQSRFLDKGVRTVGVLVLRDPVDRLVSELKFRKRLSAENKYTKTIDQSLDDMLLVSSDQSDGKLYGHALETLTAVFREGDFFVCLYEELFQQQTLDLLCDQLGIFRRSAEFEKLVNATPSKERISRESLETVRGNMAESYEAAVSYFGHEKIGKYWRYA